MTEGSNGQKGLQIANFALRAGSGAGGQSAFREPGFRRLGQPQGLPATVADLLDFLGADFKPVDALGLPGLIAEAADRIGEVLGRLLVLGIYEQRFAACGERLVLRGPVDVVDSCRVQTGAGRWRECVNDVLLWQMPAVPYVSHRSWWPHGASEARVTYRGGEAIVPASLRLAVLALVGVWFEDPEAPRVVPAHIAALARAAWAGSGRAR